MPANQTFRRPGRPPRTHCPCGAPITEETVARDRRGYRIGRCRQCAHQACRQYRSRHQLDLDIDHVVAVHVPGGWLMLCFGCAMSTRLPPGRSPNLDSGLCPPCHWRWKRECQAAARVHASQYR